MGEPEAEELANLCAKDLGEVAEAFEAGMAHAGACKELTDSFLSHAIFFDGVVTLLYET